MWGLICILHYCYFFRRYINSDEDFSAENDPANDCLDNSIITEPKLRTKKTIKKLQHIAGRVLIKK